MPTYQNRGSYLLVEITEPYSLQLVMTAIHEVADRCRTENLNKVLIDARNGQGNPSLFDRFQIGVEIVKTWGTQMQIATVTKRELINRMIENTAVNRGTRFQVFPDMEQAFKWLEIKTGD